MEEREGNGQGGHQGEGGEEGPGRVLGDGDGREGWGSKGERGERRMTK